jgi:hypothetical protein
MTARGVSAMGAALEQKAQTGANELSAHVHRVTTMLALRYPWQAWSGYD